MDVPPKSVLAVSYRAVRRLLRTLYPNVHTGVWMGYGAAAQIGEGGRGLAGLISTRIRDKLPGIESLRFRTGETVLLTFASDIAAVEFKLTYADALED